MARRFAINPDYLQSIPRATRERSKRDTAHHKAPTSAPRAFPLPAILKGTTRQHGARLLGAATLASILAFALAISPGENPDLSSAQKALAKIQTIAHNPTHALHDKARNKPDRRNNGKANQASHVSQRNLYDRNA
jgi:hypothetical protein